jgi:hypothetical protein
VIPEIDIWRAANLMLKRYGVRLVPRCSFGRGDNRSHLHVEPNDAAMSCGKSAEIGEAHRGGRARLGTT